MPVPGFAVIALMLLLTTFSPAQSSANQTSTSQARSDQARSDQANDRAYIRQAESDWAESVVSNDVSVLERILADDFVGIDVDGSQYSKASAIHDLRTQPSLFASNHLQGVEIRFYGDTAVAQGSEVWKKKDGKAGEFVWTDTWVKRGGKWQIVAAEDLVPGAATGLP